MKLIFFLITIYCLICIAVFFIKDKLIFFPNTIVDDTPKDIGLEYEEVWLNFPQKFTSKIKQENLHCWWIENKNTSKVLLYLHGNAENIGKNLTQAYPFYELGLSIFLVDYRGYGKSKGKFPTEKQVYEDAQKAWHYLVEEKNISPQQIVVFGHSLGGAIAIELATRYPEISGLIIEGSFTSLSDIAAIKIYGKLLPVKLLINQQFNSLKKVKNLNMPILFNHGMADPVIPYQMSEKLFKAANCKKQLLLIPKAVHSNIVEIDRENYLETVKIFLKNVDSYLSILK